MALADIASGTPPAVTHEMLEEWRKIADDVNAALTMGGEQGIEILASLMAEWCAAVDDVNTAREVCVVLAAKMLGTAAVARLFALTHPALMRLRWFANLYGRWKPWKDALIAHMKATAGWRAVQAWVHRLRASLRALRDWFRH